VSVSVTKSESVFDADESNADVWVDAAKLARVVDGGAVNETSDDSAAV